MLPLLDLLLELLWLLKLGETELVVLKLLTAKLMEQKVISKSLPLMVSHIHTPRTIQNMPSQPLVLNLGFACQISIDKSPNTREVVLLFVSLLKVFGVSLTLS